MPKDHYRKEDQRIAAYELSKELSDSLEKTLPLRSAETPSSSSGQFTSGKYNGRDIESVPTDYLESILNHGLDNETSLLVKDVLLKRNRVGKF